MRISDDDTPIYFVDPNGTNAKTYASSDYLMTTWAGPELTRAQGLLNDAQQAWTAQRNDIVQKMLVGDDHARHLETVYAQYGKELSVLCGITNMGSKELLEAFDPNKTAHPLRPETCFMTQASG